MYFYYGYDMIGWGLMIIAMIITIVAQVFVNSSYNKYRKVETIKKKTGFEIAREILDANGLEDIYITETKGVLSDHYDPQRKVVRLSSEVFHGSSVASNSVAAHECGHAIQDKNGYFFLRLRGAIIPFVNLSSKFGYFAILIGFIFGYYTIAWIGVGLELVILFFQLITLPVEFDASKRAKKELERLNLASKDELSGTTKMLRAAAFTYVASLATTLLELLRLVLIISNNQDN